MQCWLQCTRVNIAGVLCALVISLARQCHHVQASKPSERVQLRLMVQFAKGHDPFASTNTFKVNSISKPDSTQKLKSTNGWVDVSQLPTTSRSLKSFFTSQGLSTAAIIWPDWPSLLKRVAYLKSSNLYVLEAINEEAVNVLYAELQELKALGYVVYVQRDSAYQASSVETVLNDPLRSKLWHLDQVSVGEAWKTTKGHRSVVVAIVDTGLDITHPDLKDNLWTNPGEIPGNDIDDDKNGFVDDIHGWNFAEERPLVEDNQQHSAHFGHGTFCAGVIAAAANNGEGVAGVAPNVTIMGLAAGGADGTFWTSDITRAWDYAILMRASITSNSFGANDLSDSLKKQPAIRTAQDAGQLVVCAAGNEAYNMDVLPSVPAGYPEDIVLSVGANTVIDTISSYSNWGLQSVDLFAPGGDVTDGASLQIESTTVTNDEYDKYTESIGTSFAAPVATGAAALILSYWAEQGLDIWGRGLLVKRILMDSVDPLPSYQGLCASGGRLNISRAMELAKSMVCELKKPVQNAPPPPPYPPIINSTRVRPPSPVAQPPPPVDQPKPLDAPPPLAVPPTYGAPPDVLIEDSVLENTGEELNQRKMLASWFDCEMPFFTESVKIRGRQGLTPLTFVYPNPLDKVNGYARLPASPPGFAFTFLGMDWEGQQIYLSTTSSLTFSRGRAGTQDEFLTETNLMVPGWMFGIASFQLSEAYAGYETIFNQTALRVRWVGRLSVSEAQGAAMGVPNIQELDDLPEYMLNLEVEVTFFASHRAEVAIQAGALPTFWTDDWSPRWGLTNGTTTYNEWVFPECRPCSIRMCSDITGTLWDYLVDRLPAAVQPRTPITITPGPAVCPTPMPVPTPMTPPPMAPGPRSAPPPNDTAGKPNGTAGKPNGSLNMYGYSMAMSILISALALLLL